VILENHMHFILQSDNLSKDIQHLKFFTAKKIINFLQQKNIHGYIVFFCLIIPTVEMILGWQPSCHS
jgi:hypothetical protein